jgi:hypothetical protein
MAERRNTENGGAEKPVWANLSAGLVTGAADWNTSRGTPGFSTPC